MIGMQHSTPPPPRAGGHERLLLATVAAGYLMQVVAQFLMPLFVLQFVCFPLHSRAEDFCLMHALHCPLKCLAPCGSKLWPASSQHSSSQRNPCRAHVLCLSRVAASQG